MQQNWPEELNKVTEQYVDSFGSLTEEELNWKVNPEKWSIAQVIDHIMTINETYYPMFKSVKEGTYTTPKFFSWSPVSNFVGKKVIKTLEPTRKKKLVTFPIWEPSSSEIGADILDRFKEHQQAMVSHYEEMVPFIKDGRKVSSPANKKFVYGMDVAFEAVIIHEKRHLNQALEVLDQMKSNQS